MDKVTVSRVEVLERLKANREVFVAKLVKARHAYVKAYKREVARLQRESKPWKSNRPFASFSSYIQVTPPPDLTKDYDHAIELMSASTMGNVELDIVDFNNWWLDRWDTFLDFQTVVGSYGPAKGKSGGRANRALSGAALLQRQAKLARQAQAKEPVAAG